QSIEAKEGVAIKDENQTLATITLQNYFRLYDKLSGMTGTAATEAAEFDQTYKLGVVPIPTNRPMCREDEPDVVYKTEAAKYDAVVEDIAEKVEKGQPVLVGTVSVEKSEYLSQLLRKRGITHEVLNAKQHEREAHIVAQAGRKGSDTVATNMAGRGTDIMLGGNPEFLADLALRGRGLSPVDTPEDYEAAWPAALEKAKTDVAAEHIEVVDAGGLYVLGTERHESRRIDNQLRGRSGRQGDPGLSRFYLSLGDDLMRLFNAGAVEAIMNRLNIPEEVPIESKMVSRAIRSAQTQVEAQNFEIRKNVLKYDEVLNRQRTVVYDERRKILNGEDLHEQVRSMVDDVVESYVFAECGDAYPEDWDLEKLWTALKTLYPVGIPLKTVEEERDSLSVDYLAEELKTDAQQAYDKRESSLGVADDGEPVMRELERRVLLSVVDRKWREHLYEMDYLQEGIGLRAMGQRDPLVEYQREGFDMFAAMMEAIKEESVGFLFNVEVQLEEPVAAPEEALIATGPGEVAGEVVVEHLLAEAPSTPAGQVPAAPTAPAAAPPSVPDPAPFAPTPVLQEAAPAEAPAPAVQVPAPVVESPAAELPTAPAAEPVQAPAEPVEAVAPLPAETVAPEAPVVSEPPTETPVAAPEAGAPAAAPPAEAPAAESPAAAPPAEAPAAEFPAAAPAAESSAAAPVAETPVPLATAAAEVVSPAAPQPPVEDTAATPTAAPEATTPAAPQPPAAKLPDSFARPNQPTNLSYSGGGQTSSGPAVPDPLTGEVKSGGPSRNAPCPCGSGRKYKRCHGDPTKQ
ncbi:MAG: protein translocase subunit secA, partial [Frankiales bacterium]|nr:protein translocase subunit secA [Frankiales bacterium]